MQINAVESRSIIEYVNVLELMSHHPNLMFSSRHIVTFAMLLWPFFTITGAIRSATRLSFFAFLASMAEFAGSFALRLL